jgi:hypothetical protein
LLILRDMTLAVLALVCLSGRLHVGCGELIGGAGRGN